MVHTSQGFGQKALGGQSVALGRKNEVDGRPAREPIRARLRAPEKNDFIGARERGKEGVPHADKRSAVMVGEKGRKQSTIN
jgi:hypothetical protein